MRIDENAFWMIKGRIAAGMPKKDVVNLFETSKSTVGNAIRSESFEEFCWYTREKLTAEQVEERKRQKAEALKKASEPDPEPIKEESAPKQPEQDPAGHDKAKANYQFNRLHDDNLGIYAMVNERLNSIEKLLEKLLAVWGGGN